MDARRYVIPLLFAGLILALVGSAGVVLARGPTAPPTRPASQDPVGFAFTYQGRLMDGGDPANGLYDLQFELFESADGPTAVGTDVELPDQPVTDGLFTVQLDFGDVFDGSKLWLQIGVRPGDSEDEYTILSERQELTAAPYALYALDVGVNYAGSSSKGGAALDLTCSGCVNSAEIQNGTILFADIGQNGCLPGQVMKWTGAGWSCTNAYVRTVIVSPVGTPLENGTALLVALKGIADAEEGNPYLLKIEPGRYDLGSQSLAMKQWVDIEGSGELGTTITASGHTTSTTGTLVGADDAELRFLTVENSGGNAYAIAVYNGDTSPRLTHMTALASGGVGYNCAVENIATDSTSPTPSMENVTAIASGGTTAKGVENAGSAPTMKDVTAKGQDATYNYGIYNDTINIGMIDVTAVASGGSTTTAIRNAYCSLAIMTTVTARAFNGSSHNWAVWNQHSPALMTDVTATALGTDSKGLINSGTGSGTTWVAVDQSRITATTTTIESYGTDVATLVGASRLAGGPVIGDAVITCAGVYDENYTFYTNTCP
jgi:hypothetical protein